MTIGTSLIRVSVKATWCITLRLYPHTAAFYLGKTARITATWLNESPFCVWVWSASLGPIVVYIHVCNLSYVITTLFHGCRLFEAKRLSFGRRPRLRCKSGLMGVIKMRQGKNFRVLVCNLNYNLQYVSKFDYSGNNTTTMSKFDVSCNNTTTMSKFDYSCNNTTTMNNLNNSYG